MSLGFTIGLRALLTAERTMDVIGQNIANAATPGYSRKTINLTASNPLIRAGIGSQGTGVAIQDIRRVHDSLLETRLRTQDSELGQAQAEGQMMSFLDSFFADLDGNGVSSRLNRYFDSVSALTASPSDSSLRGSFIQDSNSLAVGFQQLSGQIKNLVGDSNSAVETTATQVSGLASQLASLNGEIVRASSIGSEPGDLLDRRNVLLRDLAEYVDITVEDRNQGSVDVLIDGVLLVSGDRSEELQASFSVADGVELSIDGKEIEVRGGQLHGLLSVADDSVESELKILNDVALSVIRETNRIHTTGIPANGSYKSLQSGVRPGAEGINGPLSQLDLAIPVQDGELVVNVVDETTGDITQTTLEIDPDALSLAGFARQLNSIPHLSASLDSNGGLRIAAESGFGFDFSNRIDTNPDDAGTFGDAGAMLGAGPGPFSLSVGDALTIDVDGVGPQTVTFNAGDFDNIGQATPAEVAAAINANIGGATASVVDGRLVLKSDSSGSTSSLLVTNSNGTPATELGLSTTLELGTEDPVSVTLEGSSESFDGKVFLRPVIDGVVGVTPNLTVEVSDEDGNLLGSFDFGEGYTPGEPIEIIPGVNLSLNAGELSATSGDFTAFDAIQDSDSSDILTSLELGAFFTGTDAESIAVADRILADPRNLAGGRTGAESDGKNFLRLLSLRDAELSELGDQSILDTYSGLVSGVGLRTQSAATREEAQSLVLGALEARRNELSGVNVNEELLNLVEAEQMHSAASRFLQTVSSLNDEVLSLI